MNKVTNLFSRMFENSVLRFFRWLFLKEGNLSTMIWRTCLSIIVAALITMSMIGTFELCETVYDKYKARYVLCENPECYENQFISQNIYFHNHEDGKGYVFDRRTHEKTLKGIAWIAMPLGGDSLVCFSDGKRRGYFNKYTGKVVIEPRYTKAWIFSSGMASVEIEGVIKFIDSEGKIVLDKNLPYIAGMQGYVFHGDWCVIDSEDGKKCGLMNKNGNIVLPIEYTSIEPSNNYEYWVLRKGDFQGVIDSKNKEIIPMTKAWISINSEYIETTMLDDNTIRRYDLEGNLIDDCYIRDFNYLEYATPDTYMQADSYTDDDGNSHSCETQVYKTARAQLCSYTGGFSKLGLITANGHKVTKPLYENITALSYDMYLCDVGDGKNVLLNSKGQIVK